MADVSTEARPPSPWLLLLEGGRAPWEYAATKAVMPWLRRVPRGDGHPVLLLPGRIDAAFAAWLTVLKWRVVQMTLQKLFAVVLRSTTLRPRH